MPDGWDLSSLTLAELRALRRRIGRAIDTIEADARRELARRRMAARADVVAVLASFGLKPEDLGKRHTSAAVGKALPPKYRDPANEGHTWSGRGSKPRWFREALAAGTPVEAMEVRQD